MPASDIDAQVRADVAAAIEALAMDPDAYGFSLTWAVMQQGNQTGIGWQLLMTLRSPLLGHPPIGAIGAILTQSVPTKPQVRESVTKALAEPQATAAKLLKSGNGHAPTLPGKVK